MTVPPNRDASRTLDGWSVSICPDCGTTVNEWLTEDGNDVVEHEQCPMCIEAAREEEWWF